MRTAEIRGIKRQHEGKRHTEAMDAGTSTPGDRELDELRRRAYGPDADIADDLRALERLRELEDTRGAARGADGETPDAQRPGVGSEAPGESPEPEPVAENPQVSAASDSVVQTAPAPARERPWWRSRWAVLVAAIAVALVVAGSAGITALTAPRADATLSPTETTAGDLEQFGSQGYYDMVVVETLQRIEAYGAVSVWTAAGTRGGRCLMVAPADPYRIWGLSCTPSSLEPSVDIIISEEVPVRVAGDLPLGSVLRFVLRGDQVLVWVALAEEGA